MANNNWNGSDGNWNVGADWSGGVPQAYDTAVATAGIVSVTDTENVGGINFSGSAELLVNSGNLDVGDSQLGDNVNSFILGAAGAIVTGSFSTLKVDTYLTGTASGTVHLEGTNSSFIWAPQLEDYPGPATGVDSANLVVDFQDAGQGAAFNLSAAFNGTVADFQDGDAINWFDPEGNGSYSSSVGNDTVTLTDSLSQSITIKFAGVSNQYSASNVTVSSSGAISTTFVPPAPQVGASTYDASTGQLVVSDATGDGTAPFTESAGDFDPTKLSLTGEDGLTYNLTGGVVSNADGGSFTVTLSAADQLQVDGLLDNNGQASTGNDIFNDSAGPTTYALSASAGFDTGGRASSGGVTVSNALTPTISGVVYDPSTGILTLNGTDFEDAGGYGGIGLGQITLTGANNQSFTFNASDYGNAVSNSQVLIDLSNTESTNQQTVQPGEEASVSALFDKSGAISLEGTTYNLAATSGWDSGAGFTIEAQAVDVICFTAGTLIRTDCGDIAVETLKRGDQVVTPSGERKPVKWLGIQTVSTRFADPLYVLPIRIRAGALGENVPSRDLLLSPDHAILIDDALFHASALVNGTSVVRETNVPETFRYYHVETDDHALILAENAAVETFIDNVERMAFDNWAEHEALYPQGKEMVELPYLRAKSHRQVSRLVRARLAERAAAISARDALAA